MRLGDSSRNGSSSAGAAAAGVAALREGGYQLSGVGNHLRSAAVAGNQSDDDETDTLPPSYHDTDEGYHDEGYNHSMSDMYAPLNQFNDAPGWSFGSIGTRRNVNGSDDAASDAPALGSLGENSDLETRMLEDFGEEDLGTHPGVSTPIDGISVRKGDDDVTEIRVRDD